MKSPTNVNTEIHANPWRVLVPDQVGVEILGVEDQLRPELYVPSEPIDDPGSVDAFVPPFLSEPAAAPDLSQMTGLRAVQLLTAGHDGWPALLPPGVSLCSGHGAHGQSTAEWVLAVALAQLRRLPAFMKHQSVGEWRFCHTHSLAGAKMLVLGAGDVAQNVRRLAEPFGATVTLAGQRARNGVITLTQAVEELGNHDIIVLALPLNDHTNRLVDASFIARMRENSLLINAARGPIVDTDALLQALREERIQAAVDVVDPEPLPLEHPLWTAPGLIITPHVGASIHGKLLGAYEVARSQILSLKEGRSPKNLVFT